ncbi:hypothetical protein A9Z42_0065450 [Trichoderma parareesei]|uniref:Uncharacterized protein n=1 Tax=Trichoderma parareesei TaxID=858221 RepID=A0A2H2ZG19_TRIPA|nr:hypothetical protein A9Z42_0065450 [Trichoderma parareesei]
MGNNTSAGPTAGTELCSPDSASIYSGSGFGSGSDSNNYAQQLVPVTSSRSIFNYHVAEPTATNRIHGDKEGIGCFTRYYLQASHIKHASRDSYRWKWWWNDCWTGGDRKCRGEIPDKDKLASNIWVKATRPTAGVKTNGASRSTRLASIGVIVGVGFTTGALMML